MSVFRKLKLPPRPAVPTEAEAARLIRASQETQWRKFDEPAHHRLMPRTKCAQIFNCEAMK